MAFDPKNALRRFRDLSDGVGLVGGLVIAATVYLCAGKVPFLSLPKAIFLVFLIGGTVVGFSAALGIRWGEIPKDFRTPLAGRIGIRAGSFALITSAVLVLWIGWLALRGVGVQFAILPFVIVPALLSILPGILAAHLAASRVAPIMESTPYVSSLEDRETGKVHSWHFGLGLALLLVALTPFLKPPMPPGSESGSMAEGTAVQQLPVSNRTDSEFRHVPPKGFLQADPHRISIQSIKEYDVVLSLPRPVISPDDSKIAFARQGAQHRGEVVILDVATGSEIGVYGVVAPARALTWSEDSSRIFIAGGETRGFMAVINPSGENQVTLPAPPFQDIPTDIEGASWKGSKVILKTDKNHAHELDLDTLTFGMVNWPYGSLHAQYPLPDGGTWLPFTAAPYVAGFYSEGLSANFPDSVFAAFHQRIPYKRLVREITVSPDNGDYFTMTSDGSVLARHRGAHLTVYYLGLDADWPIGFHVHTVDQPDFGTLQDVHKEAMRSGRLRAFVAGPVINPLNGKVIGPDRRHVKATVGISGWDGAKVDAWVIEEYETLQRGDVAFFLNWTKYEGDAPNHFRAGSFLEWWGRIGDINPEDAEKLAISWEAAKRESTRLQGGAIASASGLTASDHEEEGGEEEEEEGLAQSPADSDEPQPEISPGEKLIHEFVRRHHAVVNSGNLDALRANYADSVEYFDYGKITPEAIVEDQMRYRSGFRSINEQVMDPITVARGGKSSFVVSYPMEATLTLHDGEIRLLRVTVGMEIALVDRGLEILYQKSRLDSSEVVDQ
ncbi:hypothetical protein BH23VER1_BH23VER1_07270 [soil metagenome]